MLVTYPQPVDNFFGPYFDVLCGLVFCCASSFGGLTRCASSGTVAIWRPLLLSKNVDAIAVLLIMGIAIAFSLVGCTPPTHCAPLYWDACQGAEVCCVDADDCWLQEIEPGETFECKSYCTQNEIDRAYQSCLNS